MKLKGNSSALGNLTSDKSFKFSDFKGASLGLGVGYTFTDIMRGDITLNYKSLKTSEKDPTIASKMKSVAALANAYYDFDLGNKLTPYITAGVGADYSIIDLPKGFNIASVFGAGVKNADGTITPLIPDDAANMTINGKTVVSVNEVSANKKKIKIAYQAGAGIAYNVTKNIALDLSYRLSDVAAMDLIKVQFDSKIAPYNKARNNVSISTKNNIQHLIIGGIRVHF